MRPRIALAALLVGTLGVGAGPPVPLVLAYAHTVRLFSPRLTQTYAERLAACAIAEADRAGIDARLVVAVIAVESSWEPTAVSPAGARGLGQLMPATALDLGVDPTNDEANVAGTVRYLRAMIARYAGRDPEHAYLDAIAAYNAGPAAVDHYGGLPPYAETRAYVTRVLALWRRLAA